MQKNLKKVLSLLLAFLMAVGVVAPAGPVFAAEAVSISDLPETMDGLSIAYPYNTETVQLTGTPVSRFEALTFESARGEVESAQMILTPDFKVDSFELTMNSLKNENGNIIPGWAFEVFAQHYVTVSGSGNAANYSSKYDMYNPTYNTEGYDGTFPDALIPMDAAIAKDENTIAAGNNQGIWVNLNVQDAAPGTYTGFATLTVNGTDMQIPVSVHIYDVAITEEVHATNFIAIWWDMVQFGEGEITRELADIYFEYLLSKRITPMDSWNVNRYDEAMADAITGWAKDPRITSYLIQNQKDDDGNFDAAAMKTTLTTLINKQLEVGGNVDLFAKGYFYIYDEPRNDKEYAVSNQITAQLDAIKAELAPMLDAYPSIKESFMDLKQVVTAPNPTDKTYAKVGDFWDYFINDNYGSTVLTGDSYMYVPQYQWFQNADQRALYADEEEVWWYGCCHPISPYPTYHLNTPLVSARVESWMRYTYGIDGFLYSATNRWGEYDENSQIQAYDYWNRYNGNGTPGDMILMYPGAAYGVEGPISSIRLENIREGQEDYEYLWQLENVYGADISAYTANLFSGVIPDTDASIHFNNRKALLTKLEELNVAANGATEIAPGQEGFVRGDAFNSAVNTTISLKNDQELAAIQFDYKITSGTSMNLALLPNWSSYYGYYSFTADGSVADGVYCQKLDDGYIRVIMELDALTKVVENPSNVITMLFMNGTGDAVGYIDNIQALTEVPEIEIPTEPPTEPATEPEEPVGITYEIATGLQIDVTDDSYEYITFEYQITNDAELSIAFLSPDWGKYYGYYSFNTAGKVWADAGVYCEILDDGYVRVVLKTSELARTNSAENLNNKPETIGLVLVKYGCTATGYIRNMLMADTCSHIYESVVTAPDVGVQGFTTHTCIICGHSYVDSYVDPIQPEEPVEVTYEIAGGLQVDVADKNYEYITFEYQITNGAELKIAFLSPDWGKYYGYYSFNTTGKVWADTGIYCETLDDGFVRVVMKTSELARTNSAENLNNKPETIGLMLVNYSCAATGYIRNVVMADTCGHIYESVVTAPDVGVQGFTTHTCIICGHSYVDSYVDPIQPEEPVEVTYEIAGGLQVDVADKNYEYMTFEYQITNGAELKIAFLSPDWGKYYGYYSFNTAGKVWADTGIYCETLDDGFVRVVMKTSELARTNSAENLNNKPETIGLMLVNYSCAATGYIRNVVMADTCGHIYESVVTAPDVGVQGFTTHTCIVCGHSYVDSYVDPIQPEEPVEVTYEIAGGLQVDVADKNYEYMTFEYQITNGAELKIAFLSPDWGKYYGYYSFNTAGKVWADTGIYCETLDDGFVRVVMKTSELGRTNSAENLNNKPEAIGLVLVNSGCAATGYIRNVVMADTCGHIYESVVTAPDVGVQGFTTHTCIVCGHSYVDSYVDPIQPEEPQEVFEGGAFQPGTAIELANNQEIATMSFDYKIESGEKLSIAFLPDWSSYYGYFNFTAQGASESYNGIKTEKLANGYIRVFVDMTSITKKTAEPSSVIKLFYVHPSNGNASGVIENVRINKSSMEPSRGTALTPSVNQSIDLDAAEEITTISFDYKITSGTKFSLALLPNWSSYFGYYGFVAAGPEGTYPGITAESLEDGYIRITMNLAELTYKAGDPSYVIDLLFINGTYSNADGFIDNVQYTIGCNHTYDAVVTNPDFENGGFTTYTCSKCGESYVTDEVPAYTAKVAEWNIALADDIRANFHLNIDSRLEDAFVTVMVDGTSNQYSVSELATTEDGYYIVSVNVVAAQMTEEISIVISTGNMASDEMIYTIRQYAEHILTGDYDESTKLLVQRMLNYGAAAQNYFGYNTDNMANVDYEMTDVPVIPEVESGSIVSGNVDGIDYYGSSLIFETKVGVRFYYSVTGSIENYTFTDSYGNTYEPVAKNGLYYVEVMNINPDQYDDAIVMLVSDGTNTQSVSYSPMRYISRKYYGSDNSDLVNLVVQMYQYHLAAELFLSQNAEKLQ